MTFNNIDSAIDVRPREAISSTTAKMLNSSNDGNVEFHFFLYTGCAEDIVAVLGEQNYDYQADPEVIPWYLIACLLRRKR